MSFDPEKVERFDYDETYGKDVNTDGEFVLASDYNRLLESYLYHVDLITELFKRCGAPLSEEKIASIKNGTWR